MPTDNFGVAGLGVMGRNVALNIERNGFPVVAYNRGDENAAKMRAESRDKNVTVTQSIPDFVSLLTPPRRVLLMVTAGRGTDLVIDALLAHLEAGDVLIDGGNSHFSDTERRAERLQARGLHFVGCGVSGGEEGALWGPSIMPGGNRDAYLRIAPVLEKIAAKTDDGSPCVTYCGLGAAGHYVKMVHNGIEYGIMQLICEVYDILRRGQGWSSKEIQKLFRDWTGSGQVGGYLVDITAQCLAKRDDSSGTALVEKILDTAGQKGTGKWTAQTALDLGIPIPTLSQAVNARILSGLKDARVVASAKLTGPSGGAEADRGHLRRVLHDALHLGMVACYAQGLHLIQAASAEFGFGTDLAEVARIWKEGCIIRSKLLDPIRQVYSEHPRLENMLLSPAFTTATNRNLSALREVVGLANDSGVPTTCLGATLAYVDSYRSEFLPANLLQALRDNFGAHTYRRLDMEGVFHTQWNR